MKISILGTVKLNLLNVLSNPCYTAIVIRSLCDSWYLSVCFEQNNSNVYEQILVEFSGDVDNGPRKR